MASSSLPRAPPTQASTRMASSVGTNGPILPSKINSDSKALDTIKWREKGEVWLIETTRQASEAAVARAFAATQKSPVREFQKIDKNRLQ